MVALLYYIPDRRRKGSPPLPSENQEEREEGSHIYTDELHLVVHPVGHKCPQKPKTKDETKEWSGGEGIWQGFLILRAIYARHFLVVCYNLFLRLQHGEKSETFHLFET